MQNRSKLGINHKVRTVSIEEAITTTMATTIQQAIVTTTAQTTRTTTIRSVPSSNIIPDYIFQGIYTEIY